MLMWPFARRRSLKMGTSNWFTKRKMVILILTLFVFIIVSYIVAGDYRKNIEDKNIKKYLKESNGSAAPAIGYEVSYALNGKVIVAFIPPKNPNIPPDYLKTGSIEEQAKNAIENHAKQVGIKLPDHFQNDILITPVVQNK
jgi:hypothetical protein